MTQLVGNRIIENEGVTNSDASLLFQKKIGRYALNILHLHILHEMVLDIACPLLNLQIVESAFTDDA